VLVLIHVLGYFVEYLPGVIGDVTSFLSFQARYAPFERGLIDTRAIVYFISVAVICLLVAFRSLESRKWS
jgi:ABC-2 type transport system permease protein